MAVSRRAIHYSSILLMLIFPFITHPDAKRRRPCSPQLLKSNQCEPCSLSAWAKKIFTLKERPVEFSSLPDKKEYQKNILTKGEFIAALKRCAQTVAATLKPDNQWLDKKSLYRQAPEIFNLYRPFSYPIDDVKNFIFKPFVQRLKLPNAGTCALFGDLHGSVHSLMRDLLKLRALGYIDDQFALIKENFYLLFLGDYIDRGIYGAEVIYTLLRLKIANPTHVFLIRGNHEDYILAPDFKKKHTKDEEKDNAPSFIDELYLKFDLTDKDEIAIFRFYDLLPVALYLGCGTVQNTNFMMCCHGGLEIGYDPYQLLHAGSAIKYELIEKLWRRKNFDKKLSTTLQQGIKKEFDLNVLCGDIIDYTPEAIFMNTSPNHIAHVGFIWNDFYVDPKKMVGQRGKKFTGWVYGQELTNHLLRWGTSEHVTLQGVFRAHQHNNETGGPMLNLLCCNKGIVNVWKNEHIYTLVSSPDSKLEDTGENCFTYDSFVLVTVAHHFNKWQLVHYWQDTGMENKGWHRKILTSMATPKAACNS